MTAASPGSLRHRATARESGCFARIDTVLGAPRELVVGDRDPAQDIMHRINSACGEVLMAMQRMRAVLSADLRFVEAVLSKASLGSMALVEDSALKSSPFTDAHAGRAMMVIRRAIDNVAGKLRDEIVPALNGAVAANDKCHQQFKHKALGAINELKQICDAHQRAVGGLHDQRRRERPGEAVGSSEAVGIAMHRAVRDFFGRVKTTGKRLRGDVEAIRVELRRELDLDNKQAQEFAEQVKGVGVWLGYAPAPFVTRPADEIEVIRRFGEGIRGLFWELRCASRQAPRFEGSCVPAGSLGNGEARGFEARVWADYGNCVRGELVRVVLTSPNGRYEIERRGGEREVLPAGILEPVAQ